MKQGFSGDDQKAAVELSDYWKVVESVHADTEMDHVFEVFSRNMTVPFLPVVDNTNCPVGVVRENDIKEYAYGRFGRELVKREALRAFIRPSLVLPHTISRDDLLASVASNPNPDGLLITLDGAYSAVLFNNVLLRLFEANRVETQVRLVQAQKMEAIGTLAGGIAHDLNNLLTPIMGYAQMMREMMDAGEPLDTDMLDHILISATRARETVGRILTFSRHQKTEQNAVHLSDLIKEVLRLVVRSLPATIEVELCLSTSDDTVFANPTELQQVIMNLVTNAYHAMRDKGGHLQISLSEHHGGLLGWSVHHGNLPPRTLRLTVRDTGGGIPAGILPKIFEPFFTTKKQGEGTGMGLAIVHGVVTRCKGAVSVESVVGRGTAIHVYLPYHCVESGTRVNTEYIVSRTPVQPANLSTLRVLYVDDDFHVARLAQKYLSRFGLAVETENDSLKALAIVENRLDDFDVLVTDQTMPAMTGLELSERVLNIDPDFPIILCTGYTEIVSPEMAKSAGIRGYVIKPPDYAKMAELIRECGAGASHAAPSCS